ncbi:MAG: DUF2064 domain-containing protein [Rhodanobacter sp.]|nr:MAG: DUF2064 domain-containing protein [Rhodanobacter sp.]
MTPALAIFVKTPGLSPVKTRLAATVGTAEAIRFHSLAAAATAAVVRRCRPSLVPYWAVAESGPQARDAWPEFAQTGQGEGDLGVRMHQVYTELQARHGRVLLIGADVPQLTPDLLLAALALLDDEATPYVLGNAFDGGFWLVGGRAPIERGLWVGVPYSQADTAARFRHALTAHGGIASVSTLHDVDDAADLPALAAALATLIDPVPEQRALAGWLRTSGYHKTPMELPA